MGFRFVLSTKTILVATHGDFIPSWSRGSLCGLSGLCSGLRLFSLLFSSLFSSIFGSCVGVEHFVNEFILNSDGELSRCVDIFYMVVFLSFLEAIYRESKLE